MGQERDKTRAVITAASRENPGEYPCCLSQQEYPLLTKVPLMYFSSSALFCCRRGLLSVINVCRVGGGGVDVCKALSKS